MKSFVNIVVEGDLDEAVLKKIMGLLEIEVARVYGKKGKDYSKEKITGYNKAAEHSKWIVLVDLNNKFECAPILIKSYLPKPSFNLQFRVAVREVEAWLLADRESMAQFLKVSLDKIPSYPEEKDDPKMVLINIAQHSRSSSIREDIVPATGSTAKIGRAYNSRLTEFVINHWNPDHAADYAPSLKRALNRLSEWI